MSHNAFADAGRFAFTYAQQLTGDLEAAMRDHKLVAECWEFEDSLTLLNRLLGNVVFFGMKWLAAKTRPMPPEAYESERPLAEALCRLSEVCSEIDQAIGWFEGQGLLVEGAAGFRRNRSAVDALYRSARFPENPRPITIGQDGCLYEVTGDRIIVPGLEPESVLTSLADRAAGRFSPLPNPGAESDR
ncbi:hypothetical protein [Tautonia sociabilis]|uniref:Uncharacterized protein n=1 Tax=Tautonia sociabilis TaxID=2080755 RepID=A0A432MMD3_9BACT|nr:hypothetical protein [Tautonia sociabilis]RUL88582.1 hypothetical protein TsocGM_06575 [Tautonia sociabilis]